MILFRPQHVKPILDGRKTETRRLGSRRFRIGSVHQARTRMLDRKSCFALLEIGGTSWEELGQMDAADVWREGYDSLSDFIAVWEQINGKGSWKPHVFVQAIRFRVVARMSDRGIRRAVFVAVCYVLAVLFFYQGHEVGRMEATLDHGKHIVRCCGAK